MTFFERLALKVALGRLESKMGTNWKGKAGAIAVMLGALAAAANDLAQGHVSAEKMIAYWTTFAGGLAAFGIRQAMGDSRA